MQIATHREDLDARLGGALDRAGIVGEGFRRDLARDLKAKVVFRGGRDAVEVRGPAGSGRHSVARAAHAAAGEILGREDRCVTLDCGTLASDGDPEVALLEAASGAAGGTLVLERVDAAPGDLRDALGRLWTRPESEALVLVLREDAASPEGGREEARRPSTRIDVAPLHERERDIWDLVDHFWAQTADQIDPGECRGFSRQAKADLAEAIRETHLASVRRLRDVVRDLVFGAAAGGPLPVKLTSELVRPYLSEYFGQTAADRQARDAALVDSLLSDVSSDPLLERLARLHGIPEDVLTRQAAVIRDVMAAIDDVPDSYRNIMDRTGDVVRASLWLLSGATTQAEFRRFFGQERFMRPTKSVAWAFYNRVFKRDMG